MKQPTHFIEVYKNEDDTSRQGPVFEWYIKDRVLSRTIAYGGKTVAIFKIFPKN